MRRFYELGVKELNGHLLYALADGEYAAASAWLERQGILGLVSDAVNAWRENGTNRSTTSSTKSSRGSSPPGRTTPG